MWLGCLAARGIDMLCKVAQRVSPDRPSKLHQFPTTPPLHSTPLGPSLAPAGGSGARTLIFPGSPPHRPRHLPRLCSLRAAAGVRWVPPALSRRLLCCAAAALLGAWLSARTSGKQSDGFGWQAGAPPRPTLLPFTCPMSLTSPSPIVCAPFWPRRQRRPGGGSLWHGACFRRRLAAALPGTAAALGRQHP